METEVELSIFRFEKSWIDNIVINLCQVNEICIKILSKYHVSGINEMTWALKALTLTDLTALSGDDSTSNIKRLFYHSTYPLSDYALNYIEPKLHDSIHTAAICVYPLRVKDACDMLKQLRKENVISVASVASGFPTGQYPLETRLKEIEFAINSGATEIDVVINRTLVIQEKWEQLYNEIIEMRKACGNDVYMKTILAVGELGSMENVYKSSMVAMMAGSDFIKTSTGKESVNATLPIGLIMINAILDFKRRTGRKVGLKSAGGIRTVRDAITWMVLIKETLGTDWLTPQLFRIGASGLLDDIQNVIIKHFTREKEKL